MEEIDYKQPFKVQNLETVSEVDGMTQHPHEGEQLRKFMKTRRLSNGEMAEALNVTRQAIYLQIKRPYLSTRFKKKLSDKGLFPFCANGVEQRTEISMDSKDIETSNETILRQEIKRLQQIIVLQADHIRRMTELK